MLKRFNSKIAEFTPFAQEHNLFIAFDQTQLLHLCSEVYKCCLWKLLSDGLIVLERNCANDPYLTLRKSSFLHIISSGGSDIRSSPMYVFDKGYPSCVWEVVVVLYKHRWFAILWEDKHGFP